MTTKTRLIGAFVVVLSVLALGVRSGASGAPAGAGDVEIEGLAYPLDGAAIDARLLDRRQPAALRALQATAVGRALPEMTGAGSGLTWLANGPDGDGSLWDGSDDIVVVQSWTRQSERGRSAMSRAMRMINASRVEGVRLVGVHTPEGAAGAARYVERREPAHPVALDETGAWLDELGLYEDPASVVVDWDGRVRMVGGSLVTLSKVLKALDQERELVRAGTLEVPAPESLAPRAERVAALDAGDGEGAGGPARREGGREIGDFPAAPGVSGAANLVGRRGPPVVAETWVTPEPRMSGKVVVAVFWATWCGPCIAEVPHVNELQSAFRDEVVVVGMASSQRDDLAKVRNAARRHGMEYAVAWDSRARMTRVVQNRGIPHGIVMDPEGVVRWQGHPGRLSEATLRGIVEASGVQAGGGALGEALERMRWVGGEGA